MNHYDRLRAATSTEARCSIASDKDCPEELLCLFVRKDTEFEVVEAAILNPMCPREMVEVAVSRFPFFGTDAFQSRKEKKLKLAKTIQEINELEKTYGNLSLPDRDEIIRKHILTEEQIDHTSSHLGITNEDFKNRKRVQFVNPDIKWEDSDTLRIALLIAPSWGVLFPPYNIAKLTGLLRNKKYNVKAYDINVESYHRLLTLHGENYWRSERYFLWIDRNNFEKYLLSDLEDLFDRIILELSIAKPDVIGFSIYNTNVHATMYLVERLKLALPNTCFIAGGPEMTERFNCSIHVPQIFNYVFVGEAEQNLLNFLEKLPTVDNYPSGEIIGETVESRLHLDSFAYPDYSDYTLTNYQEKTGVSAETSRGCVAQCSFCSETYYWKFRSLDPLRTINEIEHQINTYGVKKIWFVDSLINGNLKNFQLLVDLILERQLKFSWNVYARCDGRMSREFLQRIADSGCTCLSFGVESGSQKVLNNMRKKIDIWEIENNLKDARLANIFTHVNWMVGFPTEEPIDWMHGLTLLFNCREDIKAISVGYGAGPAPGSHLKTDPSYYGISKNTFLNNWTTEDYTNTILHRFLRIKLTHIWIGIINQLSVPSIEIHDSISYSRLKEFYQVNVSVENNPHAAYVEYDNYVLFDSYDFISSIESEYLSFFYIMHRSFGSFFMKIKCDPELDKSVFGNLLASNYTAVVTFIISKTGSYSLRIQHEFNHSSTDESIQAIVEGEKTCIGDMSFTNSRVESGNINDWVTDEIQVKPSIKERNKKIIKIIPDDN